MRILVFDVETTGLDPEQDRVIQLAWGVLYSNTRSLSYTGDMKFDPEGRRSTDEALKVHKITDQELMMYPTFREAMAEFVGLFTGELIPKQADVENCPFVLCGYNGSFDMQMLSSEFARMGVEWPAYGALFIDPYRVWNKLERRTLAQAYKRFCGEEDDEGRYHPGELDESKLHDARYDIEATAQVLMSQAGWYRGARGTEYLDPIVQENASLIIDAAGKLRLDENGLVVYAFGKHVGQPVKNHPDYAAWMLGGNFPSTTKTALTRELNRL